MKDVCNQLLSSRAALAIGGVASTGTLLDFFRREWSDAGELAYRGPFHSTAIEQDMSKNHPFETSPDQLGSESRSCRYTILREVCRSTRGCLLFRSTDLIRVSRARNGTSCRCV